MGKGELKKRKKEAEYSDRQWMEYGFLIYDIISDSVERDFEITSKGETGYSIEWTSKSTGERYCLDTFCDGSYLGVTVGVITDPEGASNYLDALKSIVKR